jgi:glucose/arabinose dehydrogenase
MFRAFLLLPFLTACAGINPTLGVADASQKLPLHLLSVPSGAKVSVYARVPNARQMVLSPNGTLFVGNRDGGGGVWAVIDKDKDGVGEQVIQIAKNMRSPNGVEFKDGSLYVGEISRILRYDNIESQLDAIAAGGALPKPVVVTDKYPTDDHHGWKYIRFGPDGWLYVPVGAPCNVCDKGDPFASFQPTARGSCTAEFRGHLQSALTLATCDPASQGISQSRNRISSPRLCHSPCLST